MNAKYCMKLKATRVGGFLSLSDGADRSEAEIPRQRDGTRTRDLSAQPARTVLTDPLETETLDVSPAFSVFDRLLRGHCSFSGWELLLIHKAPRYTAPGPLVREGSADPLIGFVEPDPTRNLPPRTCHRL